MELITKSQIRSIRNNFERRSDTKTFTAFINEHKTRKSYSFEISVFLSHKHDELEELRDAVALLRSSGVSVYIDTNDEGMPTITSGLTATRLKEKIRSNKKFILLATEASISSKWCNWELGYGDAFKYIENIALLVVKNDNTIWSGNEYLKIYPTIGKKSNSSEFEVQYPDGRIVDLVKWLKS